jgi:hypothetical protein
LTNVSPDCRMKPAISLKSPFSHNILFGFMTTLISRPGTLQTMGLALSFMVSLS